LTSKPPGRPTSITTFDAQSYLAWRSDTTTSAAATVDCTLISARSPAAAERGVIAERCGDESQLAPVEHGAAEPCATASGTAESFR
jgi:hypothetical protein